MSCTFQKMYYEYTVPFAGGVGAFSANSGAASSLDLRTVGNGTLNMSVIDQLPAPDNAGSGATMTTTGGCVGRFVDFYADGIDVGVIFGATSATVTGGNAPVLSAIGANSAGTCVRIAAGTYRRWFVHATGQWLGFVGSSTGTLRIAPSSRPM